MQLDVLVPTHTQVWHGQPLHQRIGSCSKGTAHPLCHFQANLPPTVRSCTCGVGVETAAWQGLSDGSPVASIALHCRRVGFIVTLVSKLC
jgi:hypothetical protein